MPFVGYATIFQFSTLCPSFGGAAMFIFVHKTFCLEMRLLKPGTLCVLSQPTPITFWASITGRQQNPASISPVASRIFPAARRADEFASRPFR